VLDLNQPDGRERFRSLVAAADVLLESTPRGELDRHGLGAGALMQQYPTLIVARMSPFGDHGPWADFKGSDVVHLALGGVMMNCGYDPAPGGTYDLPPISPQMWHAFHVAGEQLSLAIVAALLFRLADGEGTAPVLRDSRGSGEIHRGRPHVVGDATRPRLAPDLPSRS
jgi:crotonobetainyl-CoA:carnitine CoA-transferase CaiB-like acyl-CoA transferase